MANLGMVGLGLAAAATAEGDEWARYARKLERDLDILQARQRAARGVIRDLRAISQSPAPDQALQVLRDRDTLRARLQAGLRESLAELGRSEDELTADELAF